MRPSRPIITLPGQRWSIQITDDQSRTLIDSSTGVAYHSASGGLAETTHVYFVNSGVADRLQRQQPTSVLEIGLGLGMGLLITIDAAIHHQCELTYTTIENNWLESGLLRKLNLDELLRQPELAEDFYRWRESIGQTVENGRYSHAFGKSQHATVHHLDALRWQPPEGQRFDAIYFDPFAPEVNPELWSREFLSRLHQVLNPGGRLVTYCVNRQVRETLAAAGFDPQRVPGPPGGKRQVMMARKKGEV